MGLDVSDDAPCRAYPLLGLSRYFNSIIASHRVAVSRFSVASSGLCFVRYTFDYTIAPYALDYAIAAFHLCLCDTGCSCVGITCTIQSDT